MLLNEEQFFADGEYIIDSFIAKGGMGEVYRALHWPTKKVHAIKILTPKAYHNVNFRRRFIREYEILRKLDHPHIIKVHRAGQHKHEMLDLPWFSMDYVPQSLKQRLNHLALNDILAILINVLEALHYIHGQKVYHRDLKPDNILIDSARNTYLTDFGIAKDEEMGKTRVGGRLGTANYVAPEYLEKNEYTPRSDIYSFGVVLYFICTEQYPYSESSNVGYASKMLDEQLTPVQDLNPGISDKLNEVIERCLQRDPVHRFQNAKEVAQSLRFCPEYNEETINIFKAGEVILDGAYEILGLLEQGGFGEIYRIADRKDGKVCALKVPLIESLLNKDQISRFKQEIRIMSHFDHPNIVCLLAHGEYSHNNYSFPYMVMPYYPGNLQDAMKESVDPEKAMPILEGILDSLTYTHTHPKGAIFHRDLKPSNILITHDGRGILTDFGIAKVSNRQGHTQSMIMTRALIGTAYYMAPEQIRGEEIDARTDVYAIGVILYEILAGRRPFEGKSPDHVRSMHLHDMPVLPNEVNSDISPRLSRVIMSCLEKDPAKRPVDISALKTSLLACKRNGKYFHEPTAREKLTGSVTRSFGGFQQTLSKGFKARYLPATLSGIAAAITIGFVLLSCVAILMGDLSVGQIAQNPKVISLSYLMGDTTPEPAVFTEVEVSAPDDQSNPGLQLLRPAFRDRIEVARSILKDPIAPVEQKLAARDFIMDCVDNARLNIIFNPRLEPTYTTFENRPRDIKVTYTAQVLGNEYLDPSRMNDVRLGGRLISGDTSVSAELAIADNQLAINNLPAGSYRFVPTASIAGLNGYQIEGQARDFQLIASSANIVEEDDTYSVHYEGTIARIRWDLVNVEQNEPFAQSDQSVFALDRSNLPDGNYRLTCSIYNTPDSPSPEKRDVAIQIDTTAPTVQVLAERSDLVEKDGQLYAFAMSPGDEINVVIRASDAISGIDQTGSRLQPLAEDSTFQLKLAASQANLNIQVRDEKDNQSTPIGINLIRLEDIRIGTDWRARLINLMESPQVYARTLQQMNDVAFRHLLELYSPPGRSLDGDRLTVLQQSAERIRQNQFNRKVVLNAHLTGTTGAYIEIVRSIDDMMALDDSFNQLRTQLAGVFTQAGNPIFVSHLNTLAERWMATASAPAPLEFMKQNLSEFVQLDPNSVEAPYSAQNKQYSIRWREGAAPGFTLQTAYGTGDDLIVPLTDVPRSYEIVLTPAIQAGENLLAFEDKAFRKELEIPSKRESFQEILASLDQFTTNQLDVSTQKRSIANALQPIIQSADAMSNSDYREQYAVIQQRLEALKTTNRIDQAFRDSLGQVREDQLPFWNETTSNAVIDGLSAAWNSQATLAGVEPSEFVAAQMPNLKRPYANQEILSAAPLQKLNSDSFTKTFESIGINSEKLRAETGLNREMTLVLASGENRIEFPLSESSNRIGAAPTNDRIEYNIYYHDSEGHRSPSRSLSVTFPRRTPEPTATPTPRATSTPTPIPTASPTPEPTPPPVASPTPDTGGPITPADVDTWLIEIDQNLQKFNEQSTGMRSSDISDAFAKVFEPIIAQDLRFDRTDMFKDLVGDSRRVGQIRAGDGFIRIIYPDNTPPAQLYRIIPGSAPDMAEVRLNIYYRFVLTTSPSRKGTILKVKKENSKLIIQSIEYETRKNWDEQFEVLK